jgi:hypothetical protein
VGSEAGADETTVIGRPAKPTGLDVLSKPGLVDYEYDRIKAAALNVNGKLENNLSFGMLL